MLFEGGLVYRTVPVGSVCLSRCRPVVLAAIFNGFWREKFKKIFLLSQLVPFACPGAARWCLPPFLTVFGGKNSKNFLLSQLVPFACPGAARWCLPPFLTVFGGKNSKNVFAGAVCSLGTVRCRAVPVRLPPFLTVFGGKNSFFAESASVVPFARTVRCPVVLGAIFNGFWREKFKKFFCWCRLLAPVPPGGAWRHF